MKIALDLGHNCPPDTGAVGVQKEDKVIMEVGGFLQELIEKAGHKIVLCKPGKANSVGASLDYRVGVANRSLSDLFISIHFNAFNRKAYGSETFAMSGIGRKYARSILNEIVELGFRDRGVKDGSHLYVVKNTDMPAVLVECCFVDSAKDMAIYDGEKMAQAIFNGVQAV